VIGMSTVMICPRCGGTVGTAIAGKRVCTCAKGGSAIATAIVDPLDGSKARPGERAKLCCVCGKDITHAKRMKDAATGRYWCVECGAANPLHQRHAMDVPCPECKKYFAPLAMIKYKDHYICAECYAKHTGKGKVAGTGAKSSGRKIIIALAVVAAGIILIAYYYLLSP
jgi:hypothetical protein